MAIANMKEKIVLCIWWIVTTARHWACTNSRRAKIRYNLIALFLK